MNDFLGQLVARAFTSPANIRPRIPSRFEALATREPAARAAEASARAPTQPTVPADATHALPPSLREAIRPAEASAAAMLDPLPLTDVSPSAACAADGLAPAPVRSPIRPAAVPAIEPSNASEEPLMDGAQARGTSAQHAPKATRPLVTSALPAQTVQPAIKPGAGGAATEAGVPRLGAADGGRGALPEGPPAAAGEFTAPEQWPSTARAPGPEHVAPQGPSEQAALREHEGARPSARPRILEIHPVKAPLPVSGGMAAGSPGQRASLAPVPPIVQVTIGRVEVRALTPSPPPPRREVSRPPHLSLDEYLTQRNGGRR
jgi:hypothetical protein